MSRKQQTSVMPSSSAAPPDLRCVDPQMKVCAGSTVRIPTVNSRVYYFPQGHLEQSSSASAPILPPLVLSKPCIGCVVDAVSFHADAASDEVFARIVLHPVETTDSFSSEGGGFGGGVLEEEKITSYVKVLTATDANCVVPFSVPNPCAELLFPTMNLEDDGPVPAQTLVVSDIHGVSWSFKHLCRGTPRRHLLSTGWTKFVNSKKLIAGDTVLFMKNSHGNTILGIRRSVTLGAGDYSNWTMHIDDANVKVDKDFTGKDGFSRNGRGRVSLESIVKSMEMAARGIPFEVIFYPRVGWTEFVVKADIVEAAMRICWTPGLRVKMAVEIEDFLSMIWYQGTVSSASAPYKGTWERSPWRRIQMEWDEPHPRLNCKICELLAS